MIYVLLAWGLALTTTEIELVPLKRLGVVHSEKRFDLSGLHIPSLALKKHLGISGDILFVNDKTSKIYQGKIVDQQIHVEAWMDLKIKGSDFEGIDGDDSSLFVVNESNAHVYEILPGKKFKTHKDFESMTHRKDDYKITKDFGIESLAVSPDWILLGKERPPLAIFPISRKPKFKTLPLRPRSGIGSQTDSRIRGSFLYTLDREIRGLWKDSLSDLSEKGLAIFKNTADKPENRFKVVDRLGNVHPEWGTAEALEITDSEIWIGLDNNGMKTDTGEERPLVLVFQRPQGF